MNNHMPTPNVPSKGKCEGSFYMDNISTKVKCPCSCHVDPHVDPKGIETCEVLIDEVAVPPHSQGDEIERCRKPMGIGKFKCMEKKPCPFHAEPPIKEVWEEQFSADWGNGILSWNGKVTNGVSYERILTRIKQLLSSHSHEIAERVRKECADVARSYKTNRNNKPSGGFRNKMPKYKESEPADKVCEDIARSIEESNK